MTKAKTFVLGALLLGFLLQVAGVLLYNQVVMNIVNCVYSTVPSTCGPNPNLSLDFFVYPTIVIGFALVGMSIVVFVWKKGVLA